MAISYFKKLHLHGQDLIFNKFQSKLKIVIEDSKLNRFLVSGLISKYNDNNNKISDDSMDTNKVYIKFMVSELETVKDIATKKINLRYDDMKTIILDGLRYNVNKFIRLIDIKSL